MTLKKPIEEHLPSGRPTKYEGDKTDKQAFEMALLGLNDEEMAKVLQINVATINNWKHEYPTFFESLKAGKEDADAKVTKTLYERAIGYTAKEIKLAQHEGKFTDQIEVDKYYPPDVTAAIFWLKNRQRKKWQEKIETTINAESIKIIIDQQDNDL